MTELKINNDCITLDEIMDFMSVSKMDADAMKLITRVNSHICKCADCREQLKAFQTLDMGFKELYASRSVNAEATLDAEHPSL